MKIPTPRRDAQQPKIADDLSGYYNQSDDLDLTMKNQHNSSLTDKEHAQSELSESQNATIFIIVSLKISLDMRQNQIGILLANNHKYFI